MNCHIWNLIFLARKSSIINAGDDYKIIVKVLVFQEYLKLQSKLSHTMKQKFSAFASCQALTAYHVFEYLVTYIIILNGRFFQAHFLYIVKILNVSCLKKNRDTTL